VNSCVAAQHSALLLLVGHTSPLMGNFYKNVTIISASQAAILSSLENHNRTAYVTPTRDGVTVVFDLQSDEIGDPVELGDIAITLSSDLACVTMAAAVYDDDVLLLGLYDSGVQIGEYTTTGGSNLTARSIARVLGLSSGRTILLAMLLGSPRFPLFVFETWRHHLILKVLGLPLWATATGYNYIHQGEPPPGLRPEELVHTDANQRNEPSSI